MAQGRELRKFVVIGGSAGCLEVVFAAVPYLPIDAQTAYLLVVHRRPGLDSALLNLLSTRTTLCVREVEDKESLKPNYFYVAPPGYHVLLEDEDHFSLDSSEKVHHSRPSIDVSFESAADVFRERVIGLLLSGANADGAAGLKKIADAGGLTLVQNPASAEVPYMPAQAVANGSAQRLVEGKNVGAELRQLLL